MQSLLGLRREEQRLGAALGICGAATPGREEAAGPGRGRSAGAGAGPGVPGGLRDGRGTKARLIPIPGEGEPSRAAQARQGWSCCPAGAQVDRGLIGAGEPRGGWKMRAACAFGGFGRLCRCVAGANSDVNSRGRVFIITEKSSGWGGCCWAKETLRRKRQAAEAALLQLCGGAGCHLEYETHEGFPGCAPFITERCSRLGSWEELGE